VDNPFGVGGTPREAWRRLAAMVHTQLRLLDNVLELTRWPIPEQRDEALSKRRIGVSVTGLADVLTLLRLRYDDAAGRSAARDVVRFIRDRAYAASAALAAERGPFPLYRRQDYLAPDAVGQRLPAAVREAIGRHGLRHSHLM